MFAVAGQAIGAGNPTWVREAPVERQHAAAVHALLQAGADVTGIAHTDEFGYGMLGVNAHYGTPPNPASPERVPGGSSSGCASAVALGWAEIGLGTDTAGSVRVPASYCGLYSFRPSHGYVDDAGRLALAPSFDTVGWLARTPSVLLGVSDVLLPERVARPIEELLLMSDLFDLVAPDLRGRLEKSATIWADRLGVPLRAGRSMFASRLAEWAEALGIIQAIEMWQTYGEWQQSHPDAVSPRVANGMRAGADVPPDIEAWARATIDEARVLLSEVIPPGTALVHPATPTAAPARDEPRPRVSTLYDTARMICAASVAGLPVLTVPSVQGGGGAIGLSIVTAAGHDGALVAALAASELVDAANSEDEFVSSTSD